MPSGDKDLEHYNKVAQVAVLYHFMHKTKIFRCFFSFAS